MQLSINNVRDVFYPFNDNWIVGTNDKDSAFIVCQCGLYRINEIDDNNNPIKLKFTHGILHNGSFEEVFTTAEGEMIRKCQQTITGISISAFLNKVQLNRGFLLNKSFLLEQCRK